MPVFISLSIFVLKLFHSLLFPVFFFLVTLLLQCIICLYFYTILCRCYWLVLFLTLDLLEEVDLCKVVSGHVENYYSSTEFNST